MDVISSKVQILIIEALSTDVRKFPVPLHTSLRMSLIKTVFAESHLIVRLKALSGFLSKIINLL